MRVGLKKMSRDFLASALDVCRRHSGEIAGGVALCAVGGPLITMNAWWGTAIAAESFITWGFVEAMESYRPIDPPDDGGAYIPMRAWPFVLGMIAVPLLMHKQFDALHPFGPDAGVYVKAAEGMCWSVGGSIEIPTGETGAIVKITQGVGRGGSPLYNATISFARNEPYAPLFGETIGQNPVAMTAGTYYRTGTWTEGMPQETSSNGQAINCLAFGPRG